MNTVLTKIKFLTLKYKQIIIWDAKKFPKSPKKPPGKTQPSVVFDPQSENQTNFQNKWIYQNNPNILGKQRQSEAIAQKKQNFHPISNVTINITITINMYIKYNRANLITFSGASSWHFTSFRTKQETFRKDLFILFNRHMNTHTHIIIHQNFINWT